MPHDVLGVFGVTDLAIDDPGLTENDTTFAFTVVKKQAIPLQVVDLVNIK